MIYFLSIVYGIHLVLLLYVISYFSVRGLFKGGAIPVILTLGKYLIYYAVIVFGFKHLSGSGILIGFTGGLYLSLIGICAYYYYLPKRKRRRK